MMNKYAYFSIVVATTLALCFATFALLSGKAASAIGFAVNFPLCLLLCVVYYRIINAFTRIPFLCRHTSLRVVCDWLCATAIGLALSVAIRCAAGIEDDWDTSVMTFLLWNSMAVMGIELYVYHRSALENEARLALIEKEKTAYQLEALKQQISPHFLFNSLNTLASLTYQDAEKANQFTKKLSAVYRYVLMTTDKPLVPLGGELRFLSSYLYLEYIRFGDAVQTHIDIPKTLLSKNIIPASLQLLVENALKHNIATEVRPLTVTISATGDAITVKNNRQPRSEVASSKKGLQNLRRQYAVFDKTISVNERADTFSVTLPLI